MRKKKVKKKTAKPKKKPTGRLKIVNLRMNDKDRAMLLKRAKQFAKGNLSAWVRHAGLKYVPKKDELIQLWRYK